MRSRFFSVYESHTVTPKKYSGGAEKLYEKEQEIELIFQRNTEELWMLMRNDKELER
jgi:hypothetical protein